VPPCGLVAARHLTLLPGPLHRDAKIAPLPTWHDAGGKRKRTGLWTFFWVGGSRESIRDANRASSKGLADSSGEPSKKLADSNPELSLIKSEDRPFEKAQRTGNPESQGLGHSPDVRTVDALDFADLIRKSSGRTREARRNPRSLAC
jgi:hypothetical protein